MEIKMKFGIVTKNHAADSKKKGPPKNSILEPLGLYSPTRQPESYGTLLYILLAWVERNHYVNPNDAKLYHLNGS